MIPGQLPVLPFPAPLKRISPSRFVALKNCTLRELWSLQEESRILPVSPRARLGTAIHRLLAEAVNGTITDSGKSIEDVWYAIIAEVEAQMLSSQLERTLVPLSRNVNDYEVQKLRACNRARELLQSITQIEEKPVPIPGFGCEVWVQSRDRAIGGFIDLVYEAPIGRVIREYKSGPLLEADPSGLPVIHPDYLAQVKLYAALYHETFSVWPSRLELMPLQGEEIQLRVDSMECALLLQQARATLNEVNTSIAQARAIGQRGLDSLATPSGAVCRLCLSRPACHAYRQSPQPDIAEWPPDAWGTLTQVQRFGNGRMSLSLRKTTGEELRVRQLTPDRHPVIPFLAQGDQVGVYNVRRTANTEEVLESSLTTIYRMNSANDK